jgi:hypothetical protein
VFSQSPFAILFGVPAGHAKNLSSSSSCCILIERNDYTKNNLRQIAIGSFSHGHIEWNYYHHCFVLRNIFKDGEGKPIRRWRFA